MGAAVDTALSDYPDADTGFTSALKHSADVFAAFKVHSAQRSMAAQLLTPDGSLKPFEQWANDVLPIASHQFGPWLRTEYDTAVLRARQAADWQRFERNKDIMPNLRWVPSTSAKPGADHCIFWGTVLPIDHQFWSSHRPGDRWNCKCSLEATDEPAKGVPQGSESGPAPQAGLKNNPGTSRQLFDNSHPYFPDNCSSCPFGSGITNTLRFLFTARKKDCCNCSRINSRIADPDKERIKAARVKYRELLNNPDYTDVRFDKKSGGVVATHIGHITHDGPKAERFFGGLTSTDLERECQKQAFKSGHTALLLDESKMHKGNQLPALDLELDGVKMDIRSVTGRGWYSNIFVTKNSQLHRYNNRPDIKEPAEALCLYFHEPKLFSEFNMQKSISYFRYYRDTDGTLLKRNLKRVYCIIRGESEIKIYDI